jgi:hypothetical protein
MGAVVGAHLQRMRDLDAELAAAGAAFASIRSNLAASVQSLSETTDWIMTNGLADPRQALAGATPYLEMFGLTTGGWLLARLALAAQEELDAGSSDTAYLGAKVTEARFYAEQYLPRVAGLVGAVTAGPDDLYAVDGDSLASV